MHSLAATDDARLPADQCDEVISNLKKTRSKYVRAQAPYGNVTWAKQFTIWADMVRPLPVLCEVIKEPIKRVVDRRANQIDG